MEEVKTRQRPAKKVAYFEKLTRLCETYSKILIVHADNVGSRQMAEIRYALRGRAIILMGKNTMIRTVIRKMLPEMPHLEKLLNCVKQNIGLVFCIDDAAEVRKTIMANKVPARARQGVVAPCSVTIPPGPTGLDPAQTSFFQALGIATKIVKGQIEIQNQVDLIKEGDKVTASQSVLLQKLDLRPFAYGLGVRQIYDDGAVYDAAVLDISPDEVLGKFAAGVQNIAAFSREIGMPNAASAPHAITEAFKHCTAVALETDFVFEEMRKIKELLDNPEALAAAAAAAAAAPAAGAGGAAAAKAEEAPEEEEEEEEDDMGFSLFD